MKNYPYFIKSASRPIDFPLLNTREYAFLGASNSGKSTLVNSLLKKNLCKTSSKPGHTSLINFFAVNSDVTFVDLPGYGYAKKSQKEREKWRRVIESYLSEREQLALCFILFDLKRGLLDSDLDLIDWLASQELPFALIATKVDKLNQKERSKKLRNLKENFEILDVIQSSSVKSLGLKQIWNHITGTGAN